MSAEDFTRLDDGLGEYRAAAGGDEARCTCEHYVVDHSDPDPYHPENVDREGDPNCPVHAAEALFTDDLAAAVLAETHGFKVEEVWAIFDALAVLLAPVLAADRAAQRAEAEALGDHTSCVESYTALLNRAEAAERALAELQAAVAELADEWESLAAGNEAARGKATRVAAYYRKHAHELRNLDSTAPARALDKAWAEGAGRVILCTTADGCTCGAPASTPAGMHHCDCAVHPGWCGQAGCLPCERSGRARADAEGGTR